jgi:2-keto-3-deoxy-L-arabinonate dehydratase
VTPLPDPGPLPVLPTVFDADGAVLFDAVARQMEFVVQCRARLACLPAFGSEFYKLDGAERDRLIETAIAAADGRVGIVVQCNHGHAAHAAALASRAEAQGAAMIATALPRNLPAAEESLAAHAEAVCRATSLPVIVQDWNPAGSSIPAESIARVADRCSNLTFIKLEEPAIAGKCAALKTLTNERVRVLSGWGGLYLQEQLAGGIAGVMPGLPLLDVFQEIWRAHVAGEAALVYHLHSLLLPYIGFSLRNLEWFHHCEKRLAERRGLLPNAVVREPTVSLGEADRRYLELLIERLLNALVDEGFCREPLNVTTNV